MSGSARKRNYSVRNWTPRIPPLAGCAGRKPDARIKTQLLRSRIQRIANLEKEKEAAVHTSKSLEDEMRSQLESRDVTISNLQGRLTVNILDRVMFDSGEAVLKPDGEAVMRKVAGILTEHPQLSIQVVGHTDNVPIRPNAQYQRALRAIGSFPPLCALAAVHFLTEQAGVIPDTRWRGGKRRVSPRGGQFHFRRGRAKNRRITINTILPDELNPIAPAPAPKPSPATNSPSGPALD